MIDLYYWTTPNGHKITLFLEETGLPYAIHPINISQGDQFQADFLKVSPNNKIPAIVDRQPADGGAPRRCSSPAPSCSISRKRPDASSPRTCARQETLQWLFWQMGGLGPMAGQNHHFNRFAPEKIPYAIDRYVKETARLYGVLDQRLADRAFVAGDDYSIADMAIYPWIVPHQWQEQDLADFPHLQRWFESIRQRPATQRAYALVERINPPQ